MIIYFGLRAFSVSTLSTLTRRMFAFEEKAQFPKVFAKEKTNATLNINRIDIFSK